MHRFSCAAQSIVDGLGGVLFRFPFRVPAYYALILRSLTVLEGVALQVWQHTRTRPVIVQPMQHQHVNL